MEGTKDPKIIISRFWHHPKIHVIFSMDGISLEIDFEDFKKALRQEVGGVPLREVKIFWRFKKKIIDYSLFDSRVRSAIDRVCEKIKMASVEALARIQAEKKPKVITEEGIPVYSMKEVQGAVPHEKSKRRL